MRPASSLFFSLILLLCGALLQTGCQSRSISETLWPDQHDPFFQLTRPWSRSGVVRDGLETQTSVVAVLRSETWRRAYVQRYTEVFGLTDEESEKMLADQMRAADAETVFTVAVTSTYPEDARLTHRLTQWRVLLRTPSGETLQPLEIRHLDIHPAKLQAFYPHHHPWQRYYSIRYPKTDAPFELLFTGPNGRVTMRWQHDA